MAKILMVSSAGGHFSELLQLNQLGENHELVYVTEDKIAHKKVKYYLKYGTRANLVQYFGITIRNIYRGFKILKNEKPDLVISTGAHTCVFIFWMAKLFKIKTIYIESYAKVSSPSLTYKLIRPVCNKVIVQHQEMLNVYPTATYLGGLF